MARTLNLGILAHVDAGKTTLSERLLYEAGVIGEIGRVDDGTTRTDSLALERQRGITIRSAVVSLAIRGTAINLIDTPGHPDFIAEVDRVLGVLDGAVLVLSAVEGVQPQTRVLMRALRRLGVPTLLFVNKVDRRGADVDRVVDQIGRRLDVTAVRMPLDLAPAVDDLSRHDDALLAAYVDGTISRKRVWAALADQTRRGLVNPVYAGSAVTGAGVPALMDALVDLLPSASGDPDAPATGRIFKIERGAAGEKVAYVRLFGGTVRVRDALPSGKVTAVSVFDGGEWRRRDAVRAGEIGQLWGLAGARIGDAVGSGAVRVDRQFAPPSLAALVEPVHAADHVPLRAALAQLAEQDPLIDVRDLAVSLYGEVQKEVVAATLAADYGIEVRFRETTPLYVERPRRAATAVERLNTPANPFHATVGLRVAPAPPGSGITVRVAVDYRTVPLYVYRNYEEFARSMEGYVRDALAEGRHGWPVVDCVVTMTACGYSVADGPPSLRGPDSTAADYRKLTPMVLMAALDRAGVVVCEPLARVRVEAPASALGPLLSRLGGAVVGHSARGDEVVVEAVLPATEVRAVQRAVPSLTSGEGAVEATHAGHRPVREGPVPTRPRTTPDPLNRDEYLATVRL